MSDTNGNAGRRRWVRPLSVGFVLLLAFGLTFGFTLFSRWSDVRDALPPEAQAAFAAALEESGGGQPYIEIIAAGTIVNRDLENADPVGFSHLKVLVWLAADQKLVQVDYPRWFVRMKISWGPNLGTMISALRGDIGQLDLSVKYRDLERLGPALVLDHRAENGSRIMLWTVAGN